MILHHTQDLLQLIAEAGHWRTYKSWKEMRWGRSPEGSLSQLPGPRETFPWPPRFKIKIISMTTFV